LFASVPAPFATFNQNLYAAELGFVPQSPLNRERKRKRAATKNERPVALFSALVLMISVVSAATPTLAAISASVVFISLPPKPLPLIASTTAAAAAAASAAGFGGSAGGRGNRSSQAGHTNGGSDRSANSADAPKYDNRNSCDGFG
jgi:uncharacterized membrane protein YgcG